MKTSSPKEKIPVQNAGHHLDSGKGEKKDTVLKKPAPKPLSFAKEFITDGQLKPNLSSPNHFTFSGKHLNSQKPASNVPVLQPKLAIGKPDDPFEKEADEMADKIVGKLNVSSSLSGQSPQSPAGPDAGSPDVQAKCEKCQEEEELKEEGPSKIIRRKFAGLGDDEEEVPEPAVIMAKGDTSDQAPSDIFESKLVNAASGGKKLPDNLRAELETHFTADFSNVRIHTGSQAELLNSQINARAFTFGSDIFFNAGNYQPDSREGRHLLAHELTHVVQQNKGLVPRKIQRKKIDDKADNPEIDYKNVIDENKKWWRGEYGIPMRYVNPFKALNIDPFTTPNAYANLTFKVQTVMKDLAIEEKEKEKYPVDGIMTESLLDNLLGIRELSLKNPKVQPIFESYGFNWKIIDRMTYLISKKVEATPLVSAMFRSHSYFSMINSNPAFILKENDRGKHVGILQKALVELNYDIGEKGVDYKFGEDTREALKNFQRDSGFEGKAVDGKLGRETLKHLDARFSAKSMQHYTSVSGGDWMAFEVTVPRVMTKKEFLTHSLTYIFNISEEQAKILTELPKGEGGWHWVKYEDVTEKHVNAGYMIVGVKRTSYEKMMGKLSERYGAGTGVSYDARMKELILKLRGTEKLYELNKKIADIEEALEMRTMGGDKFDRMIEAKNRERLREKLAPLKKERDAELKRLGLDNSLFKEDVKEFKEVFAKFAAHVAFRMLDQNEKDANIELIRYQNEDYSEGSKIRKIFTDLKDKYDKAETEWWNGISEDLGEKPGSITTVAEYWKIFAKKNPMAAMAAGRGGVRPEDHLKGSYNRYKYGVEGKNSSFVKCHKYILEANEIHLKGAKSFPVLANPKLKIRENIKTWLGRTDEEIEKKLAEKGEDIKENIKKTRAAIKKNYPVVWELNPVIIAAKNALGIRPKSIHETLILEEQKKHKDKKFWEGILMAALGITLGLLALASGPLGWAALAGSIAVGSIDAYITYKDIQFKREAAGTAFDPAKALSDVEPGYFWFYVSLATIGLDVFQGLKAVKGVAAAAKAEKEGAELAVDVVNALRKDKKALEESLEKMAKEGADTTAISKQVKQLGDAITRVDSGEFAKHIDVLRRINDFPQGVVKLASAMMVPDIGEAIIKLEKLVGSKILSEEGFKRILYYYAGPGHDFILELPETMRVVKDSKLARNAGALEEVLTNPRAQKVMLDADDPDMILKHWDDWQKAKAAGKLKTFKAYLEGIGFTGTLKKYGSLGDAFGTSFYKLPNLTKNRQLLRLIEPVLGDAFNAGKLPTRLHESLEGILKADILGKTTDLARAKTRMMAALKALGASVETHSEFRIIMNLISYKGSVKAVFEAATSLKFHKEYTELLAEFSEEIAKKSGAIDDFMRIGPLKDRSTVDWLLHNDNIRRLIANNPGLIKALKKCASPCFPLLATEDEIREILRLIDAAKEVDFAKLNHFLYINRKPKEKWQAAVEALKSDFTGALKKVPKLSAKDITLPPRWKDLGATPLKDLRRKAQVLIDRGWSPKQLEDIFVQASIFKIDPTQFVKDLRRATAHMSKEQINSISGLMNGLSSTKRARFDMAYYIFRKVGDFAHHSGVDKLKAIFDVFKLDDLVALRNQFRFSSELAEATGEASAASFEVLANVASKIDGSRKQVLDLINQAGLKATAGSPDPNILRLENVLNSMGKGKHAVADVAKALEEAKALLRKLREADDMGDLIWGVAKGSDDKWRVTSKFFKEGTKEFSTSKAINFIKGKADELARAVLKESGEIDTVKWQKLKEAIENTDMPTTAKNHIIGTVLWPKVNIEKYLIEGADEVVEEVTIRIKGTGVEAVVDAVVKKDGTTAFKEFKTGAAKLSDNQEKVYKLLKEGRTDKLEPVGEKAKQVWADPADFKASEVEIVRDPTSIK